MSDETIFWYQLDPTGRAEIAADYQGMALDHLNLGKRAHNALLRHDPTLDVAALLLADESIRNVYQLGVGALAQINERMLELLNGSVPLVVFKPPPAVPLAVPAPTAAPERRLPEAVASQPLELLRLPLRSANALKSGFGHLLNLPLQWNEQVKPKGTSADANQLPAAPRRTTGQCPCG